MTLQGCDTVLQHAALCLAALRCALHALTSTPPAATHVHGTQTHSQMSGWACKTLHSDSTRTNPLICFANPNPDQHCQLLVSDALQMQRGLAYDYAVSCLSGHTASIRHQQSFSLACCLSVAAPLTCTSVCHSTAAATASPPAPGPVPLPLPLHELPTGWLHVQPARTEGADHQGQQAAPTASHAALGCSGLSGSPVRRTHAKTHESTNEAVAVQATAGYHQ